MEINLDQQNLSLETPSQGMYAMETSILLALYGMCIPDSQTACAKRVINRNAFTYICQFQTRVFAINYSLRLAKWVHFHSSKYLLMNL